MDHRHRLITYIVMINKFFTNMNKLDQIDNFNSKDKDKLYKEFKCDMGFFK